MPSHSAHLSALPQALALALALALASCDTPAPSGDVTPTLDDCLDPLNLNAPGASCARDLALEPRACLSVELSGGRVGIPAVWRRGALLKSGGEPLTLPASELGDEERPSAAALTLWRRGEEGDCDAVNLSAPCLTEDGCALRVRFSLARAADGRLLPVEGPDGARCAWAHPAGEGDERCDGVDNDCDGLSDEGFEVGAPCGEGEGSCAVEGVQVCAGDREVRCAVLRTPEVSPERCDGLDNDCDGLSDEGLTPSGVALGDACSFGLGDCELPAFYRCVSAEDERALDALAALTPPAAPLPPPRAGDASCLPLDLGDARRPASGELDSSCDGVDEDCDGFVDEGFVRDLAPCGEGACAAMGQVICEGGELRSTCAPGAPAPLDELCDGVDEDCDGRLDEDALPSAVACGLGECARVGDRFCFNSAPRDVCTPGAPLAGELDARCDLRDDDCDGRLDEGFAPTLTSCGVGACAAVGALSCVEGSVHDSCEPLSPTPDDTCNGVDEDCDGRLDEATPPQETSCGVGACRATGVAVCDPQRDPPSLVDRCAPLTPSTADDGCDGVDIDCDGRLDENHAPAPTQCGVGACARSGALLCVQGRVTDSCISPSPAAGELDASCDGVDDDCDGRVDEGHAPTATTCGPLACATAGTLICAGGVLVNTCVESAVAVSDPTCDGRDDDCDGRTDEDAPITPTTCGLGACVAQGALRCVGGQLVDSCVPLSHSINERDTSCDRLDQDCDGRYDEGFPTRPLSCGVGACAAIGLQVCLGGATQDLCTPGAPTPDTSCDLIDQDCDGRLDEGYAPTLTSCGRGACARSGQLRCLGGAVVNTCSPGAPSSNDPVCDGVDSDCDDAVDEDFSGTLVICGVGACAVATRATCVSGQVSEACTPNQAASAPDTDCDRVDDDCDGLLDEAYVPQVVQCPPGSCVATAQQICTNAGLINTCVMPTTTVDASCDGVDDDCDGLVDEDYTPPAAQVSCGVGACLVTSGHLACVQGSVVAVCTPNINAAAPDTDCDGVDDDCDGRFDEAFLEQISCGVGSCTGAGFAYCDEGVVVNDCTPDPPTQELCGDALDNDCDGRTDEGFERLGDFCDVSLNECYATGREVCSGDRLTLTCSARITPGPELCNGRDDDCDGLYDEGPLCSDMAQP